MKMSKARSIINKAIRDGIMEGREGQYAMVYRNAFEVDMDPAKVSGACTALVKDGLVVRSEVKVEKSRKVAYSIA